MNEELPKAITTKRMAQMLSKAFPAFLSTAAAEAITIKLVLLLQDSLLAGTPVELDGIGKLKVVLASERRGYNPVLKASVVIPAKRRLRFSASEAFHRRLKQ